MSFEDMIFSFGLFYLAFNDSKLTWSNNQTGQHCIWARLDRILLNGDCPLLYKSRFASTRVDHLPRVSSDHSPLVIFLEDYNTRRPGVFRFQRMWIRHSDFHIDLNHAREILFKSSPGRLTRQIKHWIGELFQNIEMPKTKKANLLLNRVGLLIRKFR